MRVSIKHRYVVVPGKELALDVAKMTKELSKANDGANPAAYKELLHVIKYMINTKNLGLKIESMRNSNKPWEIYVLAIMTMQETR